MKARLAYTLILASALVPACSDTGGTSRPVVPRVTEILSDRNSVEFKLLSEDSELDRNGAVFILGEERDCAVFSSELASCDYRNNVDGSVRKDGLPDFCGERICSIVDCAGGDFLSFLENGMGDSLRARMVDLCLLALDTLCYVSPYDLNGLVSQPRAKLIVLAPSVACQYGLYDVDSLFRGTGCDVRVINPLASMRRIAFDDTPGAVGVMTSSPYAVSAGIYSGCTAFVTDTTAGADKLISFLDSYRASGGIEPLKSILVDDPEVDTKALNETLVGIRSVMNEEFLTYSPLLTDNFRIIDARRTVSSECAEWLRSHNMYTHLILRPRCEKYMTVSRPELVLIPYNERYVREGSYGL